MRLSAINKQVSLSVCNTVNKFPVNIFYVLDIFVGAKDVSKYNTVSAHIELAF